MRRYVRKAAPQIVRSRTTEEAELPVTSARPLQAQPGCLLPRLLDARTALFVLLVFAAALLAACAGGDSDSNSRNEARDSGSNGQLPTNLGAASLSWLPPTDKTDGSPLTDLAGYRIYWGRTQAGFQHSATVDNPGISAYVVEGLAPGQWRFAVTAFDAQGIESGFSNTAVKVIPE